MAIRATSPDDPLEAFVGSQVFERLFSEGMSLVEETAAYLDGPGREAAKALSREQGLKYAAVSMDLSTRLMQAASWLVMQKAVRDGDMTATEASEGRYRLARHLPLDTDPAFDLRFRELATRAGQLFDRILRLDDQLYGEGPKDAANPVSEQIDALKAAAQAGAFDPLAVWKR
jgi:regulator of CtrA degradation